MPVLLTRASEKHFFIKKINIFKCVTFKKIPPVTRFFGFLNVIPDTAEKIVYYYQPNNLGSLDKN
jgi:hypothetical protein